MIPSDRLLVSLTYDWIAKSLYITERLASNGQLILTRREIYNTEIQETVFHEI